MRRKLPLLGKGLRPSPMGPYEISVDGQMPRLPVKLDFTSGEPRATHSLPTVWWESVSAANPVELVDALVQACETNLCLQNVLRPLVPRTTWYQAADAAWQWRDNWPVEELVATIMFTDITGFTALLKTHPVRRVLDSLNGYFALLCQIIQRHRGDVHKFLGDGLMALFICPADAVKAGCEIQRAVAEFNVRQAAQGLWRFETRLAIDTGEVVLASVGSLDRRDYTLIGRPVNQAAHLSEKAAPGTVWISQSTYDQLVDKNGFVPTTIPVAQSEREPTTVYEMACLRKGGRTNV